jgi:MoaA/NifB/PqqE/SkfB family radical SAM enzyme
MSNPLNPSNSLQAWKIRARRLYRCSPRQLVNQAVNRAERKLGRNRLWSKPLRLDLVPTHRCNLACVGCVRYQAELAKDLSLDFFKEILEQSASWALEYKFCSIGEPLLNPDLPEMLQLAGERGVACSIINNGTRMTPELADFLIESTKTDKVTFSIDGACAETCEKLRRGIKFEQLLQAGRWMAEAKEKHQSAYPIIIWNFVAMRENIEQLPELVRLAAEVGIELVTVHYLTVEWRTALDDSLYHHPRLQKQCFEQARRVGRETGVLLQLPVDIEDTSACGRCRYPWDQMIIDTDGTARMCYFSWEENIGNVRQDGGILKVWNNALYRLVRSTIDSNQPFYKFCSSCGMQQGFSRAESHIGKNSQNADRFSFDWQRPDAPEKPSGVKLHNPRPDGKQKKSQADSSSPAAGSET